MLRTNWVFWLNSALLHGIVILLLWFPYTLHVPTRTDLINVWRNTALYFERTLHPEQFARAEQQAKAAAQQRIAQLPPALITRAKPRTTLTQIRCPNDARASKQHGSVFLTADISAQGKVGKITIIEPSPNPQINQRILHNFAQARFIPAIDAQKTPAPDQIHFNWPYDCRK